jgi:hypothetical protein
MPPTAQDYIDHACEINRIAGEALRLKTQDATSIAGKVSIGLSLQAMELVGKAILTSIGVEASAIRAAHKNHDVLTILADAQKRLGEYPHNALRQLRNFLLWAPTINDVQLNTTIRGYLEKHFAMGATARPRSYFYPDEPTFTGPQPIQAIFVMTEHLIEVAREISRHVNTQ